MHLAAHRIIDRQSKPLVCGVIDNVDPVRFDSEMLHDIPFRELGHGHDAARRPPGDPVPQPRRDRQAL